MDGESVASFKESAPSHDGEDKSLPAGSRRDPSPRNLWNNSDDALSTVQINLAPSPHGLCKEPEWTALMEIKCDSLRRPMRRGFSWSAANVQWERGQMIHDLDKT